MKITNLGGNNYLVEFTDQFGIEYGYTFTETELRRLGRLIAEKFIRRLKGQKSPRNATRKRGKK